MAGGTPALLVWCLEFGTLRSCDLFPIPFARGATFPTWKSYTSHAANKMLARRGTFWMPEYFDHLIRDAADFAHAHRYILENPAKAGLQNWPWAATLRK
jgi:hypothetical protein